MSNTKINKTEFNGMNISHVDTNTGEVICKTTSRTKIIVEEEIPMTEQEIKTRSIPFCQDMKFLKMIRGTGKHMKEYLTNTEIATTVFLTDFICYEDCVLRKNGDARGHELNVKEIAKELSIPYDTFRKTMSSLKKKQVIGIHDTGDIENSIRWITVNPYIFCRGNKVQSWICEFYKGSIWNK